MLQVEQKRAYNKLKHNLEPYRSLIVQVRSVLSWQKNYYPGIIFGSVSFIFLLLWVADLSFITLISMGMLLLVVSDYILPTATRMLVSGKQWNGELEAEYDSVCETLCHMQWSIVSWYEFMFKEPKSTMFVIFISAAFLALAWVGTVINNLLLMYVITLALTMWPGLQHKHIFKTITEHCGKAINSKIHGGSGDKKKGD